MSTQHALFHCAITTKEEGDSEGGFGLAHPHEEMLYLPFFQLKSLSLIGFWLARRLVLFGLKL